MISEISCFLYFPDGNWPPCSIIKSIKFYMQTWSGGLTHIAMPIFLKTGLSKADILQFFSNFQNGCCHRYLGCLKLLNFIGYLGGEVFKMAAAILDCRILLADDVWRAQTHHCAKFSQNWSFNCGDREFSNFENIRRRHLRYLKLRNFIF